MKKSVKLITQGQFETCLQLAINIVNSGKPSWTRNDVLKLIKQIYNSLLHCAVDNEREGFSLPVEEEVLQ